MLPRCSGTQREALLAWAGWEEQRGGGTGAYQRNWCRAPPSGQGLELQAHKGLVRTALLGAQS